MSTVTQTPATVPETTEPPENLYRLNVDEYERIGSLLDTQKVELIDGFLVKKMTKNSPHSTACSLTEGALRLAMPINGWYLRIGEPVRIPDRNYPEPDVALVRGGPRHYKDRHPGPDCVALVVEVADTTLAKDRRMAHVYGDAGIPYYWIVNLADRQIEVYSDPRPGGYAKRTDLRAGDLVAVVIEGAEADRISVSDLLP
jgi:Uma2 family endonuclease